MKNFIRSFYEAMCLARLKKAQYEIARQLWLGEYRHESFDYILNAVQTGNVDILSGGGRK